MKRLYLLLVVSSTLSLFGADREAEKVKVKKEKKLTAVQEKRLRAKARIVRAGRKRPARGKASEAIRKYYELRRVKSFDHHLRIFINPKSNHSTKARAAQKLVRLTKQITSPANKKYVNRQLQRHHLSPAALQKEAKSASSFLNFNHLINRYAKRAKVKHGTPHATHSRSAAAQAKKAYGELTGSYKNAADRLLKEKGTSLNELAESSKPPVAPKKVKAQPSGGTPPAAAIPTPTMSPS